MGTIDSLLYAPITIITERTPPFAPRDYGIYNAIDSKHSLGQVYELVRIGIVRAYWDAHFR